MCFFDETEAYALAFSSDITANRNIRIIIDGFFAENILLKPFSVLIHVFEFFPG